MSMDVDLTADLADGSFDAGASVAPPASVPALANDSSAQSVAPPGTQPTHGPDAAKTGTVDKTDDKEPALRDVLSNAFKGNDGKPAAQADANSANSAPALTKDEAGKYRNLDGTFANAEQIAAFEGSQQAIQPPATNGVPAGLTAAEAAQFQLLPAELRQYVERKMEDLDNRATRYSEYDRLEQGYIGARREAWAANGLTPEAAISQLFALSDFAGKDPGAFAMWFAEQHGLDLDALLDEREAAQGEVDPKYQALHGELQQVKQQLGQFTNSAQQQEQAKRENIVRDFALEKDEGGTLKRPYFTNVATTIGPHITALRQNNPNMPEAELLQRAYDAACWADVNVRTQMQKQVQQQQQQTAQQVAQRAKSAGSSVTGGPVGSASSTPNNDGNSSIRDTLKAAFAEHSA